MTLPGDEVHVWFHDVALEAAALADLSRVLTSAELVRARRYRVEADRRRSIVARAALRLHLSRYCGGDPGAFLIAAAAGAKPEAPRTGVRFNVSHSGDLIGLAFSTVADVGVDVERIRPVGDATGIAARYFSRDEQRVLAAAADAEDTFFQIWTAKEAVVKGTGQGLGSDLSAFTVPLGIDGLTPVETGVPAYTGWCVAAVAVPRPGYRSALAVRQVSAVIRVAGGRLPLEQDG